MNYNDQARHLKLGLLTPIERGCDACARMTHLSNRLARQHQQTPLGQQPDVYQKWRRVSGDTLNHMLSHYWGV